MKSFDTPGGLPELPEITEDELTQEKFAELLPLLERYRAFFEEQLAKIDAEAEEINENNQHALAIAEKQREIVREKHSDEPELLERQLAIIDELETDVRQSHEQVTKDRAAFRESVEKQATHYRDLMASWRSTLS